MGYKTPTARHRDQDGGYQRERGGRLVKGQVSQIYGDRRSFDFCGGFTMQYMDVHLKPTQSH